jgi:hypothetical protein
MPNKFDFISPDILLREVDMSELPPEPANEGALIIGQATTGPAMKPVRITSLSHLKEVFGKPQNGQGVDGEGWRLGNRALPHYGLYAAQAWLASNTSPVTFVRLAGDSDPVGGTKAGWALSNAIDKDAPASCKTAYGLWICPSASDDGGTDVDVTTTGSLAAIIYSQGASVTLSGTVAGPYPFVTSSMGTMMVSDPGAGEATAFVIEVHTATDTSEKFPITLNPGSDSFIRNKMNTDPHYLVTGQKNTAESYFLGETFETDVLDKLSDVGSSSAGKQFGIIMPLAKVGAIGTNWGNHEKTAAPAKTGWIIANEPSPQQDTSSFQASNMKKLFRVVSRHEGEEFQKKYGVQIVIDGLSTNSSEYSAFSLNIYDIENGSTVESYSQLTLNPNDEAKYVARAIGDTTMAYNSTTEKFDVSGKYANKSDLIYIDVHPDIAQAHKSAVPFGFYGPAKPVPFKLSGSRGDGSGSLGLTDAMEAHTTAYAFNATASAIVNGHSGSGFCVFGEGMVAHFEWPELKTTSSGSVGGNHYDKNKYFGVRHTRKQNAATSRLGYNYGEKSTQDYIDLVRALPSDLDVHSAESGVTEPSFIFTLDEIVQDGNNSSKFFFDPTSHRAGSAETAGSGSSVLINTKGINKLFVPFFGGCDGVDIKRVDPFSSLKVLTGNDESNHYAYKAVHRAIDFIKDPEYVKYDLVSMPGLTNTTLVRDLINNTQERADALAIVDIDSGFVGTEISSSSTRGSVNTIVTNAETQDYNTSYAATYYPEVVLGGSSVAGIGAIAASERQTGAPWFAPAGFNRGGIRQLGGRFGPIVQRPYEINPIANLTRVKDQLYSAKRLFNKHLLLLIALTFVV